MRKHFMLILSALFLLAGCTENNPENAKEVKELKDFLTQSPEKIAELTDEVSADEAMVAANLIHKHVNAQLKSTYAEQWQNETLVLGDHQLKFKYKKFGEKPAKGWSLYISMHGGGGAPAEVNDQQWENQKRLYTPAEGIYMAPRAPTDSWNMWHQSDIDEFFSLFIQLADIFEGVNLNRVYITGYSAGGDGTYQLAPRMADRLAAAAMMAGHPNDASPLSLRNLPFAIQMGAEDGAYRRNEIAAEWGEKLDELQAADPKGYVHFVKLYEGMGHWMERKDTAAFNWMGNYDRQPLPEKIVWKQASVKYDRFYWLAVPKEEATNKDLVIASIEGQTITIEKAENIENLSILLNDKMLDLGKKVTVKYNDKVLYNDKPVRNIANIWKSLNQRNDLNQVFSAEVKVQIN